MKANFKNIILLLVVVVAIVFGVSVFNRNLNKAEPIVYTDIIQMFERDQVVSFELDGNLNLTMKVLTVDKDNGDGTYTYKKNEKGEYIYSTVNYALSYNIQLEKIHEIALEKLELKEQGEETNLEKFNFAKAAEAPWWAALCRSSSIVALILKTP